MIAIGNKVKHKNHLDWGIGIVIAPSANPEKVFVKFNLYSFGERPCTIINLILQVDV